MGISPTELEAIYVLRDGSREKRSKNWLTFKIIRSAKMSFYTYNFLNKFTNLPIYHRVCQIQILVVLMPYLNSVKVLNSSKLDGKKNFSSVRKICSFSDCVTSFFLSICVALTCPLNNFLTVIEHSKFP